MLRKGHGGLYKAPAKEDRSGRLREEGDKIKFIDLRFERRQKLQDSGEEEESKTFHELHVLGTNVDLWDRARGVGSEIWKELSFWWS